MALQRRHLAAKGQVEKMMQAQKFADKMTVAENCGAAKVINKLENFMRRKQLRVKDLFNVIDQSGDGTANADEVRTIAPPCTPLSLL